MNDLRLLAALLSALTLAACSDSEPTTAQTATDDRPTAESALERDLERTAQAAGELADDAERTLEGAVATTGDAIEAIVEESETLAAEATDATGEGLEQAGEGLENLADRMGDPNAVVGILAEATDATGEELEQVGDLLERGARQLEPEGELEAADQAAMETVAEDTVSQSPEEIEQALALGQELTRQGAGSDRPSDEQFEQAVEQGMTLAQQDSGTESQTSGQVDQATAPDNAMAEGEPSPSQPDQDDASSQQSAAAGQQGQSADQGQQPQLVSGPGTNVDPQTQEAISHIVQEAGQAIEQLLKGEISPDEARAKLGQAGSGSAEQSAERMSPYPTDASSDEVEQTAREAINRIMSTAQEAIDRIVHLTAQASQGQGAPAGEGLVEQAEEAAGQAAETTGETVEDVVQATERTAQEAVEATEETLGEAARATGEVVEDAVEATGEALQEAEQVVEETVEDTGQAIEEAAEEAGEALGITAGEQPDTQETVAEEAGEVIATEGQQATRTPPDDQAQGRDDTATRQQNESKPAAALPGVVQPTPAAQQQQAPTEPLSTQGTGVSGDERIESLRDSGIPEEMVDTIEENLDRAESNQPTNRPEQTVPEYQMTDQDDAVPQGTQGGTLDKPMGNTMDPNFRTQTTDTVGDSDDQPRTGPDGGGMLDTDEGPGPYTENRPGGKFDDPSHEERGIANYPQGQPEGVVKVEGEEEPRPAGASAQGEVMGAGGAASGRAASEGQQTGEADSQKMPALNSAPQEGDGTAQTGTGQPTDNQTGPLGEADAYKEPVEHSDFQVQPDEAATEADEAQGRVEQMLEDATRPSGEPKPFDAARQAEQAQD